MPGGICSVATCDSSSNKAKREGQHIRFFNFPKDPSTRNEWIKKCKRVDKFDPTFKRVCSLHFKREDYEDEIQARLMKSVPIKLKKGAVPSINLSSSDSQPENSSSPADETDSSERRKRYSDKIRKQLVAECLAQHKEREKVTEEKKKTRRKIMLHFPLSQIKKEVLTNLNKESSCCVSKNCIKCQLRVLQEQNKLLITRIKTNKQTEKDLKGKIELLQKQVKDFDSKFENKVKDAFKHFLSGNQVDIVLQKKTKVRWTEEEISKAFSILQYSKRFYMYLKSTLNYPLPGFSTLTSWARHVSLELENAGSAEYLLSDQTIESENIPSDHHLNFENVLPHQPTDSDNQPPDQPIDSENLPPEDDNSNDSLNLGETQIKMFCSKAHFPADHPMDSETVTSKGEKSRKRLNKNKPNSTIKSIKFQSQLHRRNFINKLILNKYLRKAHKPAKEKPFVCSQCQKGFYQKNSLKRHFKVHTLENPWTCDVCNEVFSSKFFLEKHISTHKNNDRFVCDICDKSFVKKITFKDHYLKHKNLQPLEVCNEELNKDQRTVVGVEESTSDQQLSKNKFLLTRYSMQTKIKPYSCHICSELFEDKNDLKTHLAVHNEEKKYVKTVVDGKEVYICESCNKEFKNLFYYKRHLLAHTETIIYVCESCNKEFRNRQYFHQHLLTHTDNRTFMCQVCDKTFASQTSLKRHLTVHENKTQFFCNVCNKGFYQKRYLSQHLLTHSGEKPYVCEMCSKRFAQKSSLKKHINTHKCEVYPNPNYNAEVAKF